MLITSLFHQSCSMMMIYTTGKIYLTSISRIIQIDMKINIEIISNFLEITWKLWNDKDILISFEANVSHNFIHVTVTIVINM